MLSPRLNDYTGDSICGDIQLTTFFLRSRSNTLATSTSLAQSSGISFPFCRNDLPGTVHIQRTVSPSKDSSSLIGFDFTTLALEMERFTGISPLCRPLSGSLYGGFSLVPTLWYECQRAVWLIRNAPAPKDALIRWRSSFIWNYTNKNRPLGCTLGPEVWKSSTLTYGSFFGP